MAEVDIDRDAGSRLVGDPGVRADMLRRGEAVANLARRVVHVDPNHDEAKEGPHLRDTIYCIQVGDETRVGSDKDYAVYEEFFEAGSHSYLRSSLRAAGD